MVDFEPVIEKVKFSGKVRPMQEEDLVQIKPILEVWVKSRDTGKLLPEEVEEDIQVMRDSLNSKNERRYFVAEEVGKVVGVIGMTPPDERMRPFMQTSNPVELVNAYVDPNERKGRGVGRVLVEKLESEAKKNGYTEVILNSGPRYEKTGWGFYDKLPGYNRVGIAERYYGEGGNAPVWSKIL